MAPGHCSYNFTADADQRRKKREKRGFRVSYHYYEGNMAGAKGRSIVEYVLVVLVQFALDSWSYPVLGAKTNLTPGATPLAGEEVVYGNFTLDEIHEIVGLSREDLLPAEAPRQVMPLSLGQRLRRKSGNVELPDIPEGDYDVMRTYTTKPTNGEYPTKGHTQGRKKKGEENFLMR